MAGSAPERRLDGDVTVTASDIARLAEVGKAAVSNWRRRFADFPEPMGGTASNPTYGLADVQEWLTRHGKPFRLSEEELVWQRVLAVTTAPGLGDLVGYLGVFLVLCEREPAVWRNQAKKADPELARVLPSEITRHVPEAPGELPARFDAQQMPLFRAVAERGGRVGNAAVNEALYAGFLRAQGRRPVATPPDIARVMVGLAGIGSGQTILDPACGVGGVLGASVEVGARVLGQEANVTSARLAWARLALAGHDVRIVASDALRVDAFAGEPVADAVVCHPPFGERDWGYEELTNDPRWEHGLPPRGEPELAWVQHALAHTKPGGHVVTAMPTAAAGRRPGRRLRGNLLRAGALRAVISLGSGSMPTSSDLWVLRQPDPGAELPSSVLVAEATDLASVEPAWRAFAAGAVDQLPDGARAVRIIDLLDEDVDLSPARHLAGQAVEEPASTFVQLGERWRTLTTQLSNAAPALSVAESDSQPARTTVADLIKAGVVSVHQAPLSTVTDEGDAAVLTAKDVRVGRAPSGRGVAAPGSVVLEPGDVVVPAAGREATVQVVTDGGALLGPQLLLYRVDPERMDAHFLAGSLRAAAASGTARATSTSSRLDPRRAPILLLPLTDQRAYGEAFRALLDLEDAVSSAADLGDELVRAGITGLADGTLRP